MYILLSTVYILVNSSNDKEQIPILDRVKPFEKGRFLELDLYILNRYQEKPELENDLNIATKWKQNKKKTYTFYILQQNNEYINLSK